MVEFYLSFNNGEEKLRLPVPPPSYEVSQGNSNTVVNVNGVGEVGMIGKGNLTTLTISSMFPNQVYPFCTYSDFPSTKECVDLINKWRLSGRPIRLVIGDDKVNLACMINTFSYGERDGTGDLYFTLELQEYRFLKVATRVVNDGSSIVESSQVRPEGNPPKKDGASKKHKVIKGDSLWAIAQKYYGDGSKYPKIKDANKLKSNVINVGMELIIP